MHFLHCCGTVSRRERLPEYEHERMSADSWNYAQWKLIPDEMIASLETAIPECDTIDIYKSEK